MSADELKHIPVYAVAVPPITFSSEGRFILTVDWRGTLALWETDTGQQRRRSGDTASTSRASPYRQMAGAIRRWRRNCARLWDVQTGAELKRFEGHSGPVTSVVFSADGRRALSASADRTVRLWAIPNTSEPPN